MNKNLIFSKKNIDDEGYTRYKDIEKYLSNFDLKNLKIYAPCDGNNSNFVKYFNNNNLIYKNTFNDFRSESNTENGKWADIIITNPPFSLKSDFYKLVKKHNCKLIVLLPDTLLCNKTYKNDLLNKKLFMDYTNKNFIKPNGEIKRASASGFNNIKKTGFKEGKFKNGFYVMTKDGLRYYNRCDNIDPNYKKPFYVPITFIKGSNIENYKILSFDNKPRYYNNTKTFSVLKVIKKESE